MEQGLKIDESVNSANDRTDYITGIVKSRDIMYRNRDIVNGKESSSNTYLSQDYLLDKINGINFDEQGSDFNTQRIDNTSTTHFVVIDKNGKLSSTTNTLSSFFGTGKYVKEGFT